MEMEPWLCSLIILAILIHPCNATKQTYIIQMNHDHHHQDHHHFSHLQSLVPSATHADLLYSYTTVFNGYAASLSPHHAQFLRHSPSVLGVYQDTLYHLHTTRTPRFLGILQDQEQNTFFLKHQQLLPRSDVIIGVLDTGVWPELKSFDDSGMPPVPARWHGECEQHKDFDKVSCNNKLIGARMFYNGFRMAATNI
nr:subtilisin-like protease SBT1.8 [Tanacetum cinerariifolium]